MKLMPSLMNGGSEPLINLYKGFAHKMKHQDTPCNNSLCSASLYSLIIPLNYLNEGKGLQ